jgi:hypothetical protein
MIKELEKRTTKYATAIFVKASLRRFFQGPLLLLAKRGEYSKPWVEL